MTSITSIVKANTSEDLQILAVTEKVNHLSTSIRSTELDESTIIDTKHLSINETKEYDADDDIPLIQLIKKTSTRPQDLNLKRKNIDKTKDDSKDNSSIKKEFKIKKETKVSKKIKPEPIPKLELDLDKKNANDEDACEGEDEEDQWWLSDNFDSTYNWETLEHNGVYFPPLYQPHNIKMKYKGKEITLSPESEEIATFFAGINGSHYESSPIFISNFFNDFKKSMQGSINEEIILNFEDCDFSSIIEYLQLLKEQKKIRTKEEKLEEKKANEALLEKYGYCLLDGKKEKIGNFRIEPPGLFRGRGEHPKMGCLKVIFYLY